MNLPVYMDHHATTPLDPRVLEAMLPYLTEKFGNPASCTHRYGWDAQAGIEKARKQVARLVNAKPEEIIFTSGATESDNLAIKGAAGANRQRGNRIVTLAIEHHAVLDACRRLEGEGLSVTYLPVTRDGLLNLDDFKRALTDQTILVSVMAANNEIGTLQPISEIGKLCRERGILFHTDAVQAIGKIEVDVERMCVDLLSISAHKIYGPKGVGALYVRQNDPRLKLIPLLDGGGHERGMRSGTLNVAGIVGLGQASEICQQEISREPDRLRALRDRLKDGILAGLDDVRINGSMEQRLPNNLNLSFAGVDAESFLMALNNVALSSGSACNSAGDSPSYVLQALGLPEDLAAGSIRFGLGRFNTEEEVEFTVHRVVETVKSLRELSTLPATTKSPTPQDKT
ncbi:MAG: IscS subfamily cysteine desulfurase [Acidobacteria bacterium]|nr:IscS subfamily cysteine desulfurase [Acidobacteriota bacterium]